MIKKRKTRVTKKFVDQMREEKKNRKSKKNVIVPGPWTNIETELVIKPELHKTIGIMGESYGSYPKSEFWGERGWYPIIINIMSSRIKQNVSEHGLDVYIAAWEKAINTKRNKTKYGTIIILKMMIDHSIEEDENHRFISCNAKTNKKSISGFSAKRQSHFIVLP